MIQGWVVWATGGFSDKELPFYWRVGFAYCGTRCTQYNTTLLSRYNILQTSCLPFTSIERQCFVHFYKKK